MPAATQSSSTAEHADERVGVVETTVGGILLQPKAVINENLTLLIPQAFSIMDRKC